MQRKGEQFKALLARLKMPPHNFAANFNQPEFAVGDILHHPERGPMRVETMDEKYFTGVFLGTGEPYGKTGLGIPLGHSGKVIKPWKVERQGG